MAKRDNLPSYMQIRNRLRDQILRGDLAPGARLLPERKMAARLGVSRTTVVAAYDELAAEGLVEARVGRGTVVVGTTARGSDAATQPIAWLAHFSSLAQRLQAGAAAEAQTLSQMCGDPNQISFAGGFPDPDLFPVERFHVACDAVLRRAGRAVLDYSPKAGVDQVRELIAARLRRLKIATPAENVMIVSGSTQGLDFLTRLLAEPGETVITESPTYFGALQIFRAHGLRVVGVPMDRNGMDVARAEFLLARYRPRFIYAVPTFQNPTGTTMPPERRAQLLDLARRYQVPIIEDDPFGALYFDQPPPPPIKSLDESGHVIYVSTFSKCLAPGLRVGWIVAPQPVVEACISLRKVTDLAPNSVSQYALAEFAQRGWLDEQIEHVRAVYAARCQAMDAALRRHARQNARWQKPAGGFFLWLELPDPISSQALAVETAKRQTTFLPGHLMFIGNEHGDGCRLNFSMPEEKTIARGIAILGSSLTQLLRHRVPPVEKTAIGAIV
jgi:DNA-binding transcriptional MocR family regulator